MSIDTSITRNADLGTLAALLKEENARKVDVVAPAKNIHAVGGYLSINGTEAVIDEDGVTTTDGMYLPTSVCDEGIADKLGIPLAYVRRMRNEDVDLWDANVNGWLSHLSKPFLVRCFKGNGAAGIARAFLSDKYATMDNLDALMATLDGIRSAGVNVDITGCDLTERRMVVRIACPEVSALAPTLLAGYRSPFSGATGTDNPTVFAGFVLANSETGGGAWSLTPRIIVQVCSNGMTITKDAMRAVHLGGRLEEGTVEWSAETQSKAVDLVRSKTVDAVRTFLSGEYLAETVEAMEAKAGKEVKGLDAVRTVTKAAKFTDEQTTGLLDFFIQGGQSTLGGVVNAATAYAQTVDDPEVAMALEAGAARLLVGA